MNEEVDFAEDRARVAFLNELELDEWAAMSDAMECWDEALHVAYSRHLLRRAHRLAVAA